MMKRLKKLFIMMMSLTVFLSLAYTQVCAYGYKVTLYTGNQGTINSQNEMSINVSKGQMVSLDLSQIELPQDSKYYVKGIRLSGIDRKELFIVTKVNFKSYENTRETVVN